MIECLGSSINGNVELLNCTNKFYGNGRYGQPQNTSINMKHNPILFDVFYISELELIIGSGILNITHSRTINPVLNKQKKHVHNVDNNRLMNSPRIDFLKSKLFSFSKGSIL